MNDEQSPAPVDSDPTTIAAHYVAGYLTKDGDLLLDDEHHGEKAFLGGLQNRLQEAGYNYSPEELRNLLPQAKLEAALINKAAEIEQRENSKRQRIVRGLGHLSRPFRRSRHA